MEVRQRGLIAGVLMATLAFAPLAEAKRAGGGKSHGMSRSMNSSQSYSQSRPASPAPQPVSPNTAPQRSGPGVGSMVAAGVAGAAVGAVAGHALASDRDGQPTSSAQAPEEKKSGIPSWIWILLIAAIAFFIFRKIGAKKKSVTNPYAPGGSAPNSTPNNGPFGNNAAPRANDSTNIFGQSVGGGAAPVGGAFTQSGNQLPDGTEPAAFLRVARQRFNHIQSVNSASNVEEIRRYLTPELYNSMHSDIMANQDQDVAEFSNLNAMVVDSSTENGQYVVSVRFTGSVSEDLNSQPVPFSEVWHFVKPVGSTQDWVVAGIQQD
ncbi:TIM44-like domain-containing protein [Acinetobacter gerneri]|uniref:TIM44-like domain-containing protein n=1 Tax=Acinetobacter gerneri TaxID=202952 RepID=A0AAW8JG91_9GAMM|nr:TIM44-like domain-containing protein [Acinetobacter gerneri]MDQ9009193.1 TIM44-like domain-containing protein [Acinetobacter gerneri]MDQ9013297.1 TIM44-like domain-containing protein [Acinetobacter gerneri]MDQ9023486.1 TIM44-like domain-containing protein [Acinetobacter gerneri]MDQ9051969.1 TIM44-like domain-containing protein [Acinetobacter gerneri]MDQ9059378.1 TIM44-like domain-containing protein [Acinetobacter gerneri]